MSFGFAPSISFSPFGFDHGFFDESPFGSFFNVPERHYFARNGLRPRRFRGEACAPLSGRCVPWRRVARSTPSIFDLISFGSDFDRFWETLDREDEAVPKIEESKEKKLSSSSASPALTSAASSSSSEVSGSSSEVSDKAPSDVATTTAPSAKKVALGEVDVKREPSATHYDVHLPGLSLGDIKLDFDFKRHALYVKAEKKIEETKEDKHGKRSFVRHVSVSRALPLPDGVKPDDVKADFVDNVLSISVSHKAIEAPTDAPTSTSLPISDASAADSTSPKQDEVTSTTPIEASTPASEASSSSEPVVSETTPVTSSETSSAAEGISASTSSDATEKKDEDSATVEDAE